MNYPALSGAAVRRVTVPQLSGGVQLNDAPNRVADDQLTAVSNFWWRDGALRTRPGVDAGAAQQMSWLTQEQVTEGNSTPEEAVCSTVDVLAARTADGEPVMGRVRMDWLRTNGVRRVHLRKMAFDGTCYPYRSDEGKELDEVVCSSCMCVAREGEPTLLFTDQGIRMIYGSSTDWEEPDPNDIYAPLVLVNGKGSASAQALSPSGVTLEGFNMLTGAFRCQFTTDGVGTVFPLPRRGLTANMGEVTRVTYTAPDGTVIHWQIADTDTLSTAKTVNGVSVAVRLDRTAGTVSTCDPTGAQLIALAGGGASNNLEIKAWKTEEAKREKICKMRLYTWFGGDRSGLGGGTRLFLAGNPAYPNLVHWSDVNQLLYFPENNYAFVGSADQPITAFGQQGEMLVLFKTQEIYYATYVAGSSFSGEDILEGNVGDVTAAAAQFPITPIHMGIGCDAPHTVQLCGNRLIWACTNGKVYTLTAANPFSECNVREIAEAVAPELRGADFSNAYAADAFGYYLLLCGNCLFALQYGAAAQPWFCWDVALEGVTWHGLAARGEQAVLFGRRQDAQGVYLVQALLGGTDDRLYDGVQTAELPVSCRLRTKLFDFGSPERLKSVRQVYLGVGSAAPREVQVRYVTENGTTADGFQTAAGEWLHEQRLRPGGDRVRRFALEIAADGALAVDSLVIQYRMLGGSGSGRI